MGKRSETELSTWSGGKFDFTNPDPKDIHISDIAHALSLQCRFNGHINEFYSVAEHSVLVADILFERHADPKLAMTGLLHDAAEAYIGDIVSPLKHLLPGFLKYEASVEKCISIKFGIPYPLPTEVKEADKDALKLEFTLLAPFTQKEPYTPRKPVDAEARFLKRYYELGKINLGDCDDQSI
jgi:hypothetical protein